MRLLFFILRCESSGYNPAVFSHVSTGSFFWVLPAGTTQENGGNRLWYLRCHICISSGDDLELTESWDILLLCLCARGCVQTVHWHTCTHREVASACTHKIPKFVDLCVWQVAKSWEQSDPVKYALVVTTALSNSFMFRLSQLQMKSRERSWFGLIQKSKKRNHSLSLTLTKVLFLAESHHRRVSGCDPWSPMWQSELCTPTTRPVTSWWLHSS